MKCKKNLCCFLVVTLVSSLSCADMSTKKEGGVTLDSEKKIKNTDDKNNDALASRAVKTLGDYLNAFIDPSSTDIKLLSVEKINWSNPSLGCPKPGFFYPQVIVPGYLVSITYQEKMYSVHMSDKRAAICPDNHEVKGDKIVGGNKNSKIKSKKIKDFKIENILVNVRQDFQQRTSIPNGEIKVISVTSTIWADNSLGCREKGKVYDKNKVKGYRVVIEARGRQYTYHTDDDQKTIACPNILSS